MPRAPLDTKQIFVGGLIGDGVVTGFTGKTLRAFFVEFHGQWSIGGDLLHLDETVRYTDGRLVERHWAVQFDERGRILGYDANRSARLRARMVEDTVRMTYDRPLGGGAEIAAPHVVIDLSATEDGGVRLVGRVGLLGLVLQRMQATLRRT